MDAFFSSIEQRDNPDFRGKPVIVGGSPETRGVVAACSYEARRFGIHSAMPCGKAVRLCPDAIFIRPRMLHYKEVSEKVMAIFCRYTDLVEPLSLDEAFLDVTVNTKQEKSATLLARQICRDIYRELQLTASAGVSFNKFLAKVASDVNKPHGITTIPPEQALSFLSALPIGRFYGVGKITEQKMNRLGIHTGGDLFAWSEERLVFYFGKAGSFLYNIVRGIDNRPVEPHRIRKSIGSETTLAFDTNDIDEMRQILEELCQDIEKTLNNKKCGGYTLTLKVRFQDFTTVTRSQTLRTPLFTKHDMLLIIPKLLSSTSAGERKVRLLGVSVSRLTTEKRTPRQLPLPFPQLTKSSHPHW